MTEQPKSPRSACLPGRRKHQFADRDSHTELKPYMCCFHCGKTAEQAMREGNKSRYLAAKEKKHADKHELELQIEQAKEHLQKLEEYNTRRLQDVSCSDGHYLVVLNVTAGFGNDLS